MGYQIRHADEESVVAHQHDNFGWFAILVIIALIVGTLGLVLRYGPLHTGGIIGVLHTYTLQPDDTLLHTQTKSR